MHIPRYSWLNTSHWGTYIVKGDTVDALIYITYQHGLFPRYADRITHYQGIIKNRDTILDWKVVPPYPQKILSDQVSLESSTLVFRHMEVKNRIDSSTTWLDKYRKKRKR